VVPAVVVEVAERAGGVAAPVRDRVVEGAGERAGELAVRATELRERAVERSGPLRDRVLEGAGEIRVAAAPVLGEARERGSAAWVALRGDAVVPPVASRRWPWALGAAVAGALAGAVVAKLMATVSPADVPGAQEPHELRAVVDTPDALSARVTPLASTGAAAGAVPAHEGQSIDGPAVPAPPVSETTFKM